MRYKSVTDYLENTAKQYPDKIAVVDEHLQYTFNELRRHAMVIANKLCQENIRKKPIAILMDKGVKCIAAFMGVAYSGNFYTPIDSKMPIERVEKILETLNPAYVILEKSCEKNWIDVIRNKYPFVLYETLQEDATSIDEEAVLAVNKKIIDTDVLYVLFTSGSTGNPKGVIINHRAVIDYIEWVVDTFDIDSKDRFANQAPFYFDNSILDIYSCMKTGSTMYIIPEKLFTFPIRLLEFLNENKITTIFWVPSALCLVANLKAVGKVGLDYLKRILFCGEPMPNKQLNIWRKAYPDVLYANLYGPTEITDVCTYYIVDREFDDSEPLPIGKACANTEILVLDEERNLVTDEEMIGELCVRGTSLSYGYYNNPQKTKEVFIQNPLNQYYDEIIYCTGDLVKYNNYGELVYVSRKDFQIKHKGHRIELGEIENAVHSIENIKNCCCLYNETVKKIVLFYVADEKIENIKSVLKDKVPEYMIPGVIKHLNEMPMNLNGKIDRNKLKEFL